MAKKNASKTQKPEPETTAVPLPTGEDNVDGKGAAVQDDGKDHVLKAILLIVPMSFLYVLMDILVHQQYSKPVTFRGILGNFAPVFPILTAFIFYTNRRKTERLFQLFFFLVSLFAGLRTLHIVNKESWRRVMREEPPLVTICVYAIVELDTFPAMFSVAVMYGAARYLGLEFKI